MDALSACKLAALRAGDRNPGDISYADYAAGWRAVVRALALVPDATASGRGEACLTFGPAEAEGARNFTRVTLRELGYTLTAADRDRVAFAWAPTA